MKRVITLAAAVCLMTGSAWAQLDNVPMETGTFSNNWESLKQWECPEWFKDAKFGLWAHWGPQCHAESGDWFARFMYYSDSPYDQHRGINFNPKEYGLKEFCRDFVAAKWDPKAIMKKYKDVGCKYFMALGNHHDNFDLWDSPYQEWNSKNMGPKRDVGAEWAEAAHEQGLRFGMSVHASHAWTWLEPSQKYDGNLTKADGAGKWWEGYDPQELYAQNHAHSTGWESSGTIHSQWEWGNGASIPDEAYKTKLQNRCRQMVNALNPDMVYFDDTVLPFWGCDNQWGQDFLAHYYNHSANQHDGKADVVVCGKILPDEQKEAMLWDVERGIPDRPQKDYWQTCTCIGQWHYQKDLGGYKSAATVVRMLIDVVSKNGNLLLSIPLNADGEYDSRELAVLDGIESWMKINGESIYGTRVWEDCFGEGPLAEAVNGMTAQGFNEGQNYTSADVRYVTKGDTIYATIMAWPSAGEYTMTAFSPLAASYHGQVAKVELLGNGEVSFTQSGKGLTINIPETKPDPIAPAFRITFTGEKASESVLLQDVITTLDAMVQELLPKSSLVNSGAYNTAKVQAIIDAIAQARVIDTNDAAAVSEALAALRVAYQDMMLNGKNPGGTFDGIVKKDLSAPVLVESENFSGTLGGRYGTLDNWTVENYDIDKGGDGHRKGLDNYGGTRGISLGVWDDKGGNVGDIANARIYRKVTLKPGTYYFGAAYNSLYGCNDKAYIFVSKELVTTDELPSKALAYYQVNQGKEGSELYGLNLKIEEETEVYIGWQANLDNGSNQQEFRATKAVFYSVGEADTRSTSEKLSSAGWEKIEGMTDDLDYSHHFFTMLDHDKDQSLVAKAAAGDKNWSGTYAMMFADNADFNNDDAAVWTIDGYTDNGTVATGKDAVFFILTSQKDPSRQFRTEGWSKVVWQTYSDFYKDGNTNDGNRNIAYLSPEFSAENGWTFKNKTSEAYIGPWTDGATEPGVEFAANKSAANAAHLDLYAIDRSKWMQQHEVLAEASEEAPINISYMIENRSFERYNENLEPLAWSLVGGGQIERGWLSGCEGALYVNNWQSSGQLSNRSISQKIQNLPAGKYRISVYCQCDGDGAYLYANDSQTSLKHDGNATMSLDFEFSAGKELVIGTKLQDYTSNNFKFDNFSLYYLGGPVETGVHQIDAAAPATLDDKPYNALGQRVSDAAKGIVIRNGRKTIVK